MARPSAVRWAAASAAVSTARPAAVLSLMSAAASVTAPVRPATDCTGAAAAASAVVVYWLCGSDAAKWAVMLADAAPAASLPSSAVCRPLTVLMAWVPVCVARSRSWASVALAVAPVAMPSSLVLSAAAMKPAALVVASACAAPPAPKCALIWACSLPKAARMESAAAMAAFVAVLSPVSTTSRTRAAVVYWLCGSAAATWAATAALAVPAGSAPASAGVSVTAPVLPATLCTGAAAAASAVVVYCGCGSLAARCEAMPAAEVPAGSAPISAGVSASLPPVAWVLLWAVGVRALVSRGSASTTAVPVVAEGGRSVTCAALKPSRCVTGS